MDVSQLFEQFSNAQHLERMVIEDRLHELEQEDPPLTDKQLEDERRAFAEKCDAEDAAQTEEEADANFAWDHGGAR